METTEKRRGETGVLLLCLTLASYIRTDNDEEFSGAINAAAAAAEAAMAISVATLARDAEEEKERELPSLWSFPFPVCDLLTLSSLLEPCCAVLFFVASLFRFRERTSWMTLILSPLSLSFSFSHPSSVPLSLLISLSFFLLSLSFFLVSLSLFLASLSSLRSRSVFLSSSCRSFFLSTSRPFAFRAREKARGTPGEEEERGDDGEEDGEEGEEGAGRV